MDTEPTSAAQPTTARFIVVEFHGDGDPFFGGNADDRPLGKQGAFLTGCYHLSAVAEFTSKQDALTAGERASNRRAGGKLGSWERA